MSVKKLKPQLSIGKITQILDGSVILLAGFIYHNVDAVLYGMIYTLINSLVIDAVMKLLTAHPVCSPCKYLAAPTDK